MEGPPSQMLIAISSPMPKISVGSTSGERKSPESGGPSGCRGPGESDGHGSTDKDREDGNDDRNSQAGPSRRKISLGPEDLTVPAEGKATRWKDKKLAFRERTRDHHGEWNEHHQRCKDEQSRGQQASGNRWGEAAHWRTRANRA